MERFVVVKSLTRKHGYAIRAPRHVTWATGPKNTFGWYRRKSDAQERADELNRTGEGASADIHVGPHVVLYPEMDFDNEHWAERHAVVTKFEKLRIRNEYRDVNKNFVIDKSTMI